MSFWGFIIRLFLRRRAVAQWKRERRHSFVLRHSSFVIFHASQLPNKSEAGKVFTFR